MYDRSNNDNIVGVFPSIEAQVKGFDQAFFFQTTNCVGMLYFESFDIVELLENGSQKKLRVKRNRRFFDFWDAYVLR
jgi:hypothetical protein